LRVKEAHRRILNAVMGDPEVEGKEGSPKGMQIPRELDGNCSRSSLVYTGTKPGAIGSGHV
jgi:hypothetical protein